MKVKKIIGNAMYSYHVKEMVYVNSRKKAVLKIGAYFLLLLIIVVISVISLVNKDTKYDIGDTNLILRSKRFPTDIKYVLFWTSPRKSRNKYQGVLDSKYPTGQNVFIKQNCPYINCYLTYNKTLLRSEQDFDAIVFNVEEMAKMHEDDFDLIRSPHQRYIFKSLESSDKLPVCHPIFDHFFNWTWTYKLDSDIPFPLFNIYDDKNRLVGPKRDMKWVEKMKHNDKFKSKVFTKNKAIIWIIPKCKVKERHQDFIKEFRHQLAPFNYSIDTYGPCGQNKCPHGRISKCFKLVDNKYFFQLVLEETFSEDFISDKVVKALEHIAIPIVIGGADYTRFLPPGSYVNAQTFDMKKLVAIVDYLIKNPHMYEYFFDWKNHYYYSLKSKSYICDLCTKLNNNNSTAIVKSYSQFRDWWNPDYKDACQRMQLLKLFRNE